MRMRPLSLEPIQIDKSNWYYEEHRGLLLVHEVRDGEKYVRTEQITIPWAKLKATMRRYARARAVRRSRADLLAATCRTTRGQCAQPETGEGQARNCDD